MKSYKVGDIIKCMVTAIENYGFFVSTEDWYSGLVHISEITEGYVKEINNHVKLGDVIYCRILEINDDSSQLKLSIKNINYKPVKNGYMEENKFNFFSLQNELPNWIEKKLKEMNEK